MLGKLAVGIITLLAMACASPEPKSAATAGLRKVMIGSPQEVERLRSLGLEIIVQEENYVVIRQDSAQAMQLREAAIATVPIQESDLVQRLVRVHFSNRDQLQQIVDMGLDVWHTEGDSLTARAFDIHLTRLHAAGIGYRMLLRYAGTEEGHK